MLRILIVAGGGGGCEGNVDGSRGKSGYVKYEVYSLNISRRESYLVLVGRGGRVQRSHANDQNVNTQSEFRGNTAYGGKSCSLKNSLINDKEGFEHFFMSRVSRGMFYIYLSNN